MRKFYSFLMAATALVLGSCSNENGLEPEGQYDGTPVKITLGTTASPMTEFSVTRASIDMDNAPTNLDDVGIFCMARSKNNVNWWESDAATTNGSGTEAKPFDWFMLESEGATSLTCLMRNVQAKCTNTSYHHSDFDLNPYKLEPKDGQDYYYPISQMYRYDFYGYYPYREDDKVIYPMLSTPKEDGTPSNYRKQVAMVPMTVDGRTDILWGRTYNDEAAAYSATYFRKLNYNQFGQPEEEKSPVIDFHHMLTQLKFTVVPGEKYAGSGDYSAAEDMRVDYIEVKHVLSNPYLVIADYNDLDNPGRITALHVPTKDAVLADSSLIKRLVPASIATHDMSTRVNDQYNDFRLCDETGAEFTPTMVPSHTADCVVNGKGLRLGDYMLVYPDKSFKIVVHLTRMSDGKEFHTESSLGLYSYGTGADAYQGYTPTNNFYPGKSYTIQIVVHDPYNIGLGAVITPWQDVDGPRIEL